MKTQDNNNSGKDVSVQNASWVIPRPKSEPPFTVIPTLNPPPIGSIVIQPSIGTANTLEAQKNALQKTIELQLLDIESSIPDMVIKKRIAIVLSDFNNYVSLVNNLYSAINPTNTTPIIPKPVVKTPNDFIAVPPSGQYAGMSVHYWTQSNFSNPFSPPTFTYYKQVLFGNSQPMVIKESEYIYASNLPQLIVKK